MIKKSYSESKIKENIIKAIDGLFYISETDSSFEYFETDSKFDETEIIASIIKNKKENLTNIDPDRFFERMTAEKEWHSEIDRNYVNKYRQLEKNFLRYLKDTKIFSLGRINKQIYIIGRTDSGKWMGVKTSSLET